LTGYWLADLCAQEQMPVVLGPALSMQAIHGGKAKHDTIDAPTIAVLLPGGMLPQADVDPAAMRATRDLLRRRLPLTRQRAERLAPLQHPNRQDNLPALGKQLAYQANRAGVAERFPDPAGHKSMEVDLGLMGYDDPVLNDLEVTLVNTATPHPAQTLDRRQSVPGLGNILALGRRYEMHDMGRLPRGQDFVSDCRVVNGPTESAGKRSGTAGAKLGQAYLQWAFSEAAVLLLRNHPAGPTYGARVEKQQGKGKALTILAPQFARAVYSM
jgi:transposase